MIDDKMRKKLREPLPSEAVSPHPTKAYLSSIKSIYVAERINEVFGTGSWTLKGEVVERVDYQRSNKDKKLVDVRFVVVKGVLEIPEHGFYGESYGGNDNEDLGDAYKGALTDAFTKIAAQQLEIGIDVFKGLQTGKNPPPPRKQEETRQKKPNLASQASLKILYDTAAAQGYENAQVKAIMLNEYHKEKTTQLTEAEAIELNAILAQGLHKGDNTDK